MHKRAAVSASMRLCVLVIVLLQLFLLAPLQQAKAQSFPYKHCRLLCGPAKKISAAFSFFVEAPSLSAASWIFFAPCPPDIAGQQKLTGLEFFLEGRAEKINSCKELSALKRRVLFKEIPANSGSLSKQLDTRIHYFLELNKIELVQASGSSLHQEDKKEDLSAYLNPTKSLDFKSAEFQNFLDEHNLRRGDKERDLDFAWRSFLEIRRLYTYFYDPKQDRTVSKLCRISQTDCGGLSYLFSSVLREAGVPARMMVGRWLKDDSAYDSPANMYGKVHVKSEFYAEGIGWVPVDMSMAVSNKTGVALDYFGKFGGNFVTFHLDPDLIFDTVYFGAKEIRTMQSPLFWVSGKGTVADHKTEKVWQTRQ